MARKSLTERSCIFFLVPLLIGCAIVAAVAVQLVHWLMRVVLAGPVGDHLYLYLGVAVAVAAVVGLVHKVLHRNDRPAGSTAPGQDVAHIAH